MATDPMAVLRTHAPLPDHAIASEEARSWADDAHRALLAAGFLTEAGPADFITCPACDERHNVRVLHDDGPPARWLVACPETGIAPVDPERLRRYAIAHDAIARWIAAQVGAAGEP